MAETSFTEDRQKSQITIKLPNASPLTPETSTRDRTVQKNERSGAPTRTGNKNDDANNKSGTDKNVGSNEDDKARIKIFSH